MLPVGTRRNKPHRYGQGPVRGVSKTATAGGARVLEVRNGFVSSANFLGAGSHAFRLGNSPDPSEKYEVTVILA